MQLMSKVSGKVGVSSMLMGVISGKNTQLADDAGTEALRKSLRRALSRQETWKPARYTHNAKLGSEIGPEERNSMVKWLAALTRQFRFYPDTFALSVALLDKFLHTVKARVKYLRCITIACFYLAAKTSEEDEVIPGTLELVRESGCGCTVSEVLRMERCILDKLGWNIRLVTDIEFLHILHALLMVKSPDLLSAFPGVSRSRQLSLVTSRLQQAACHACLAVHSPATLAVAALSMELEQFSPDWLPLTGWLLTLTEECVDLEGLIWCHETMRRVLGQGGVASRRTVCATPPTKPTKRRLGVEEEEDFYDGIKRLYNDEMSPASSCSVEARIETIASRASCPLIAN